MSGSVRRSASSMACSADGAQGCFAYTTESAEAVGNLLNLVEWTVLKP